MQLSTDQLDALTEIVNIGVGRAASVLYELVDQHITLRVPQVRVCSHDQLGELVSASNEPLDTSVLQDFTGTIGGRAVLAFPQSSGIALAKILGEQEEELDELELDLAGILEEVGNIVLNAVLGSLANLFEGEFLYEVPQLKSGQPAGTVISGRAEEAPGERTILVADAHFGIADSSINGSLLLAFSMDDMPALLDRLIESAEV